MAKWTKMTFMDSLKEHCKPHVVNVIMDIIKFTETEAEIFAWGRGEGHGTLTYKVKSEDWGIIPIFHVTTDGKIKFLLNYMRGKVRKKEILRDFTLKLECNFMMDFEEDTYPSDIFFTIEELFHTHTEVDKFKQTVRNVAARLHQ